MTDIERVAARRERVAEMREAGMSQGKIARILGVGKETIETDCLVLGVFAPGQKIRVREIRPCIRNGRLVRPFTPDEDARLAAMSMAGESYKAMGRALGRTGATCRARLLTLAKREEAAA